MIKNIIFDIGNVLAAFRWKDYIDELGFSKEKAERVARATTCNELWKEIDRGAMSLNDIIEAMIATDPELAPEIEKFFSDRRRLVMEYGYSAEWLRSLKSRGYNIYLLSNYSEDHFEFISKNFTFFGIEDGMVISYREKLLKPDARIYNILCDRYGLVSEESVFIDDSEANIRGAEAVGMNGIVFKDYAQGSAELEKMLNDVK